MKLKPEAEIKEAEYLIGPKTDVTLKIPAGANFRLEALDANGEITTLGMYNPSVLTIERFRLNGYAALMVSGEYLPEISTRVRQVQEPHDHNPVERKPQPDNMLAKIRQKVKREMGGLQRESFLENDTGLAGYELDEDEPERFEEEILADLNTEPPGQPVPDAPGDPAPVVTEPPDTGSPPVNAPGVSDDPPQVRE